MAQNLSMARWLAGVEMGLAVGIALCVSELTNYFAEWMLPLASADYGVGSALLLGSLMGVGSLSVTVLASALDAWGNDQLPKAPRNSIYPSPSPSPSGSSSSFPSLSDFFTSSESISVPSPSPAPSVVSSSSSSPPSTPPSSSPSVHTVITTRVMTATMSTTPSRDIKSPSSSPSTTPIVIGSSPRNANDDSYNINNAILSASPTSQSIPPLQELPNIGTSTTPASPAKTVAGASIQLTTTSTTTADDVAPGTTTSVITSYRGSTSTSYGTAHTTHTDAWNDTESSTTHASIDRQINEEGGHRGLLILLCLTSIMLTTGGVLGHGLDNLDDILNFAAASGPVVGWIIDRAGRPCSFLAAGASLQVATLTATIIVKFAFTYTNTASSVMGVIMGIAWSIVVCSSWSGLAILVPGGWGGIAFASVTAISNSSITLAPILHKLPGSWIPALVLSMLGVMCALVLHLRKSVLNLNAHNILSSLLCLVIII